VGRTPQIWATTRSTGTKGGDTINGESGKDWLYGGGGSDTISGGGADDHLFGEADGDTLYGGGGKDWLHGGAKRDILKGGPAKDVLYGARGDDDMWGQGGDDVLCDTSWPNLVPNQCPSFSAMDGGLGNDKAWINHLFYLGTEVCPNVDIRLPAGGLARIEEARDDQWDWTSVTILGATVYSESAAWPECSTLIGLGGF